MKEVNPGYMLMNTPRPLNRINSRVITLGRHTQIPYLFTLLKPPNPVFIKAITSVGLRYKIFFKSLKVATNLCMDWKSLTCLRAFDLNFQHNVKYREQLFASNQGHDKTFSDK